MTGDRGAEYDGSARMTVSRPVTVPGAVLPGACIGDRYVVLRPIGQGGMGQVFEVEHRSIGRRFALKLIRVEAHSAEVERRFVREARALGRVVSARVAQVTDFGSEPGLGLYYVMEYVEGETLEQRLDREDHLPAPEVVSMGIGLCEALGDVHEAGVVHRDVKPGNVALCCAGPVAVKLLDFGLAVSYDSSYLERITRGGDLLGSLYYLAPEVLRDQPLTPAVDLYALGALLYESLTGRPPFDGESAAQVIGLHLQGCPPAFAEAAPDLDLPAALEAIVARLLDKVPEERFRSARAAARALRSIVL